MNIETVKAEIKKVLSAGKSTVETFNGVSLKSVTANITTKQALEFAEFFQSVCTGSGRTQGKKKEKSLSFTSDWWDIEEQSFEITSYSGLTTGDRRNYITLVWSKENN